MPYSTEYRNVLLQSISSLENAEIRAMIFVLKSCMRHETLKLASLSFGLKRSAPNFQLHRRRYSSLQTAVFSGIQPTGVPHIGNYLGALRQWVQMQARAEPSAVIVFSIVDLHALTVQQDAIQLRRQNRETLAALLAIGLDPQRVTIFHQSAVLGYFGPRNGEYGLTRF